MYDFLEPPHLEVPCEFGNHGLGFPENQAVQIGEVVRICPEKRAPPDHPDAKRAATVRDLPG